jgi:DNA-binding CsgD family transcriptional regulator
MPMQGQQLGEVLARVSVPSFALDARLKVRWLNDAASHLLGDVRRHDFGRLLAPHDAGRLRFRLAQQLAEGSSYDYDAVLMTGSGALAHCRVSSAALRRDGLVVGLFGLIIGQPRELPAPVAPDRLTPRQYEVLKLVAWGVTTEAIAAELNLSRETVRNHVRAILRALGARNRLEAVAIARRDGLLQGE